MKYKIWIWLQRQREEMEKELADQFGVDPPQVNICPPSPQNNEDLKTPPSFM